MWQRREFCWIDWSALGLTVIRGMNRLLLLTLVSWLFLIGFLLGETGGCFSATAERENCAAANQREITLSVQDPEGRFADTLRPEDLSFSENKAVREILKLARQTDEPLSLAILIDTSASQERVLAATRLAAQMFIETVLRSNKDRAAIVSFTGGTTVEQDLTNDLARLRAAIDRVKFVPPPGYLRGGVVLGPPSRTQMLIGATAIWDAIGATVHGIKPAVQSRRTIVLLTDGEDTASRMKLREAIEHAATHGVAVYAIGIGDNNYNGVNRGNLKRLAEGTGGRAFFPRKPADIESILSETAQALKSQYLLSYCAANQQAGGKPHMIEIEIKNPQMRQSKLQISYPHFGL